MPCAASAIAQRSNPYPVCLIACGASPVLVGSVCRWDRLRTCKSCEQNLEELNRDNAPWLHPYRVFGGHCWRMYPLAIDEGLDGTPNA